MATFAGHYAEALIDLEGDALVSTQVKVYVSGTSTLAQLYASRAKTVTAANPAQTSASGNLELFVDPGDYEGVAVVSGVDQARFPIVVGEDPAEGNTELAVHSASADPHGDRAVAAAALSAHTADTGQHGGSVAAHEADGDPHSQYATDADLTAHTATTTAAHGGLVASSDGRLTDTRTPTDASVTDAKVAPAAAIAESKLTLASDAAAGTASRRTLGTGGTQAAAGNDARLSDARTPTAHAASHAPAGSDDISATYATRAYADAIASGLDPKASVRVATTAAGTLATGFENGDTIDGVVLATGNRILIKNQAAGAENGIYTVNASGAPTRSTDADIDAEVTPGLFTFVEEGTTLAGSGWVLITAAPITLGSTALVFTQFSASGTILGGAGLVKTGNTLDVGAGTGLAVAADTVGIAAGGVGGTEIAAGIKDPAAGTAGLRTLGAGATQAAPGNDSRLSDQRTPSDGSVTNAKVASGAAIAWSKIVPPATAKGDIIAASGAGVMDRLGVGTNGQILTADSTRALGVGWNDAPAGGGGGGAPSGAAGGDLTGTYPNPQLAAGSVTDAEVAAANKDGLVAVPSLRTLGSGNLQAAAGNHAHAGAGAGDNAVNTIYNVKDPTYGAVGDSVTDDTASIQAAIDAAAAANGGTVFFPRGKYKITSTLIWKWKTVLEGAFGNTSSEAYPSILWYGAAGGTMIQTDDLPGVDNRPFKTIKRLSFGCVDGQAAPGIGIHYVDRVDFGSALEEVQVARVNGIGILYAKGGINVEMHRCRFDSIRDWTIKWVIGDRSDRLAVDAYTWDNNPNPNDTVGQPGGGGFLWMDGSGMGNNAQFHLSSRAAKLETNKTLNGATHGAAVDALFKFTCNPFITGDKIFLEALFDDVWNQPGPGVTVNDSTNPAILVTPSNSFVQISLRNCRRFPVSGVPGYNQLLTGTSRYIAEAIVHPTTPRMNTSPSTSESSAIELAGLANVRDLAVLGKYSSPVISSTGADFTTPVTLYKGWILENPAQVTSGGAKTWLQVLANCTVGTALSGVTATRTTANQGTLSDVTNVWVGHFITVEGNSYEVTARIPGTSTIEVFPNWATTPVAAAVTYTPLTTRTLDLSGGAGGTPSATVVAETSYGQASAAGSSGNFARGDHSHGSPALGSTGTTAAAGNHSHAAYATVADEGSAVTQRATIDFAGAGVTVSDDGSSKTVVTIPGVAGGAVTTVEDEGAALTQRSNINFAGAGVTATDSGGKTLVTIPGGTTNGYQTVLDEGAALTARTAVNFAGAGVTVSDDAGNGRTLVTIPGGGGASAYSGLVNVKDAPYSAAGNGVTNDGPAFQAALTAVSAAGGGTVLVPPGTYLIGQKLLLPYKVSLVGYGGQTTTDVNSGRNETTLRLASGVNDALITTLNNGPTFGADAVQHSIIQGIHFEGNSSGNPSVPANVGVVAIGAIISMTIRDVSVNDGKQSNISCIGSNSLFLVNCWFIDTHVGSSVYWNGVGDSLMLGCSTGRGALHNMHMFGCQYNLVSSSFFYNQDTTTGASLYIEGSGTVGNSVIGCRMDDNAGSGITLKTATRNTISGNVISRNSTGVGAGIYLTTTGGTGAKYNTIVGNQLGNSQSAEVKQDYGLKADDDCIGNVICGNTFQNNSVAPTLLAGTAVTGNTFSGNNMVPDMNQLGMLLVEQAADMATPAANQAALYCRDNGAGKTQIVARLPSGSIQVIATDV